MKIVRELKKKECSINDIRNGADMSITRFLNFRCSM